MNVILGESGVHFCTCGSGVFTLHAEGFVGCALCKAAAENIVFAKITPETRAEKIKLLDELLGDITFAEALAARGWRKP